MLHPVQPILNKINKSILADMTLGSFHLRGLNECPKVSNNFCVFTETGRNYFGHKQKQKINIKNSMKIDTE